MSCTVELAIVALVRPANKNQTAVPIPGFPQHQGAQYRVQIVDAVAGADMCCMLDDFEAEQKECGDAAERLAGALRSPFESESKLGEYLVRAAVVEEAREMKLSASKGGYLARAAAKVIADRAPVGALALNDYMEDYYPADCFGSRCLKKLNRALEPYGVGVLPVAPAA